MNRIEKLAKAFGLLLCLFFIIFQELNPVIQFTLFGVIMLTMGIPHGAIDHLISNPKIDRKGLGRFLLVYLTLIASYLAIWFFFPIAALIAFLLMSAYHFGQSHFISENQPEKYPWLLYVSRGGYFLFAILLGDWEVTKMILSPLLSLDFMGESHLFILIILLTTSILAQEVWGPKIKKSQIFEILILGPILFFSPLLVGFVVYFGFWHALPSMMTEYKFLSGFSAYNSVKKFGVHLLPFSIISFIGIGLILFLGLEFLENKELILLFFVMISLISFPHILYMDSFLKSQSQN